MHIPHWQKGRDWDVSFSIQSCIVFMELCQVCENESYAPISGDILHTESLHLGYRLLELLYCLNCFGYLRFDLHAMQNEIKLDFIKILLCQ